jgi:hypothetical protein
VEHRPSRQGVGAPVRARMNPRGVRHRPPPSVLRPRRVLPVSRMVPAIWVRTSGATRSPRDASRPTPNRRAQPRKTRLPSQSSQRLARGRNHSRRCSVWCAWRRFAGDDGSPVRDIEVPPLARPSRVCVKFTPLDRRRRFISTRRQTGAPRGERACPALGARGRNRSRHDRV